MSTIPAPGSPTCQECSGPMLKVIRSYCGPRLGEGRHEEFWRCAHCGHIITPSESA